MKSSSNEGKVPNSSISRWLLIFGLTFAFLHIMPVFLKTNIRNQLLSGDLLDFFTPFVIVFVVYKIFSTIKSNLTDSSKNQAAKLILIFASTLFVNGHGMHLSANAIARHLVGMETTAIFRLDYLFDEILGHIFWDSGVVGLSVGIILLSSKLRPTPNSPATTAMIIAGAIFYGFTYFCNAVEGQTVVFTLPCAAAITGGIPILAKSKGLKPTTNPVLSFYLVGYSVSLALFIYWGLRNGGFPQFSELGWI